MYIKRYKLSFKKSILFIPGSIPTRNRSVLDQSLSMTDLRWRNFQESRPLLKTEESGVHAPTSSPNPRTNKQCSNIREVKTGPVQVHRYCFLTSTWCTRNNPCDFRKMSLVFGRLEPLPQKYNRVFVDWKLWLWNILSTILCLKIWNWRLGRV